MAPAPEWVQKLTPSGPQGSELLAQERAKSNVNVEKLSNYLLGKENIERQRRIMEIMQKEKVFDKGQDYNLGRVEKFPLALARAKKLRMLQVKHNWTLDEYRVADSLTSEPTPYGLHASMFLVSTVHRFSYLGISV
jgi:acyl-CoA oxidase